MNYLENRIELKFCFVYIVVNNHLLIMTRYSAVNNTTLQAENINIVPVESLIDFLESAKEAFFANPTQTPMNDILIGLSQHLGIVPDAALEDAPDMEPEVKSRWHEAMNTPAYITVELMD